MKSFIRQRLREDLNYHHVSYATKDEYVIDESSEKPIEAYHGTKTKINSKEGFLTKYVKSGIGDTLFGWGLYFTDVMDIAKSYASNNKTNEYNRILSIAMELVGDDISEIIDFFVTQDQWYLIPKGLRDLLLKNKGKSGKDLIEKGYLYSVTITPSKPNVLKWYEDVSPKDMQKFGYDGDLKGGELYKLLVKKFGSDEKTSKALYDNGFYGILYPTGTIVSNEFEKGTNYVIFNEKDVKITDAVKL